MSRATVASFKFFWADQDVEPEQWLREMVRNGLHRQKINVVSIRSFVGGEPAGILYRVDFNNQGGLDYVQPIGDREPPLARVIHRFQVEVFRAIPRGGAGRFRVVCGDAGATDRRLARPVRKQSQVWCQV